MLQGLPIHLTLLFGFTTLLTVSLFFIALKISSRPIHSAVYPIMLIWIVIQAILGWQGFYRNYEAWPPHFLVAVIPPNLVTVYLLIRHQRLLCALPLRLLTFLHIVRIPVEIILFGLCEANYIPRQMTYEGRNFDILAGMTGPFMAIVAFRGGINKRLLLIWNLIALALLINIVANAILSAPFPFQQFAFEQPNVAVFYFPFIWLPAVIVPIVLFSHVTSIVHLLKR